MAALSRAEAERTIALIEKYLREGYKPRGMGGNAPAAFTEAARELRLSHAAMGNRLVSAEKQFGLTPDWSLYNPPEAPEPLSTRKPVVRMPATTDRVPEGPAQRVLAIGDAHDGPELPDKSRFRWMGRHAAETGADWVVQIGDFLTLDSLNRHIPNDSLAGKLKNPFYIDLESGAEAVGEFDRGLGSHKPRKHTTNGNHERRAWLYEEGSPESANLLTGPLTSLFEQHGWSWSEYGEFFFLGGVGFVHAALNRLGKTYGGKNSESTIANDAVFDIVIGHSHSGRVWRAPKIGPSQFINVVNLGCSLPFGYVAEYAKHATTGWTYGVYDLLIRGGHIESASFVSMPELERRYGT